MVYRVCVLAFSAIALIACKSTETPESVSITPPPVSEGIDINLGGFAWIFEFEETARFPGYRGIFLSKDGRLLLINFPNEIGDKWEIQGNWLSLSFLQGAPELMDIPLTNNFFILVDDVEDGFPKHIRLIPEYHCDTMGISLIRGTAEVDLVGNYWLLKTLVGAEDVNWPIDTDIHMILLPGENGLSILSYGGVNRFRGSIELGDELFKVGPLASTLMNGPYLDFENYYVSGLTSVNSYIQVDFNLFLYSDTMPVVAFRAHIFD